LFSLSIAFTDIFIKLSLTVNGRKKIFDLSLKAGCTTFFTPGAVSERSGHSFYSVVAVPGSAALITIQAAEFSGSTSQQSALL